MKKIGIYALLLVAFITVSCKKEASLQSYLVESQNKKGFVFLDIPASILQLGVDKTSEENTKALKSIRKIHITALPYKNADQAIYEIEIQKIKVVLKNSAYKKLINFKKDGMYAAIYYLGEADAIDEIIAFAYGKNKGVGIARVLGDNMNPGEIMEMMKNVKVDNDTLNNVNFEAFTALLGGK